MSKEYDEVDFKAVAAVNFAAGQGVIQLLPDMTDEQILWHIKDACAMSKGMAFKAIPPRTKPE